MPETKTYTILFIRFEKIITNEKKETLTTRSKITFLAELKASIGDQKIDVILDTDATKAKENSYRSIKSEAVEL